MCFTFQVLNNLDNKINVNCAGGLKTESRQDNEWVWDTKATAIRRAKQKME